METSEMVQKHACDTCGKVFDAPHLLKNHIRLSHVGKASKGRELIEPEKKPKAVKADEVQPNEPAEPMEKPAALTPDESALFDQISRSKPDWEQFFTEDDLEDFSLAEDPMKLPKEAARKQELREYAFHWAEDTSKRIAQMTSAEAPNKWWIVNRTTAPWLPSRYFDPTVGAVRKHGCILMMRPWKLHEAVKRAKNRLAEALYESRELSKGGAAKVAARDASGHIQPVTGDRAQIRGGDAVFEGELVSAESAGDLVAEN